MKLKRNFMFEFPVEKPNAYILIWAYISTLEWGKDSTPPPFSKDCLLSAKSGFCLQLRVLMSTSLEAHEIGNQKAHQFWAIPQFNREKGSKAWQVRFCNVKNKEAAARVL